MRKVVSAVVVSVLLLSGCSSDNGDGEDAEVAPRPVRGDIEVSVTPMSLDELPEAPEPGVGEAILGNETFKFAVTFCDEATAIGTGAADGREFAWDIRDDGDHRVSIRLNNGEDVWVRGGPAEGEWDKQARIVRFAGAFVKFRAENGKNAKVGGLIATCPPLDAPADAPADDADADAADDADADV